MFTGKNKEQFEKWLNKQQQKRNINYTTEGELLERVLNEYFMNELPFSMQSGVYLEYLDSVGYYVFPDGCACHDKPLWNYVIQNQSIEFHELFTPECKTRQEALTEAFKKADELINNS